MCVTDSITKQSCNNFVVRKQPQEIPSRGRGRRVNRGNGLASATQKEIEEVKRQEMTGIIPELTERKLLLEEQLEKAGFYPSL